MIDIRIKRVYEASEPDDVVDRLWPRGISKERMQMDLWLKDAAPSTALRTWFNHERSKWENFKRRYFLDLGAQAEAVTRLLEKSAKGRLTLLFAAQDVECNHAVALREYLISRSMNKSK